MYEPWLVPLVVLVAAPFIGSFIGLLVMRLPEGRPVVFARSTCDHCSEPLSGYDLVPIFSWMIRRARCRYCGSHLSAFYPLVELGAFSLAAWAAAITAGWVLVATVFFGWGLLTLALIDWRTQTLPDIVTLPLAGAGLTVAFPLDHGSIIDHVLGAAAGFMAFEAIAILYRLLRGRVGLGHGDAKLLAALGAWVSWIGLPTVVLYAGVIGLAAALASSLAGQPVAATDRLPFGTFLAIGGWLVWLYGPVMLN